MTQKPAGMGHNRGPTFDPGYAWRKQCWSTARAELLPKLPIEILRGRVHRAQELGLPYRTYASVRAGTGRDVIGFLFSTNALRMIRQYQDMPAQIADRLDGVLHTDRVALAQHPIQPAFFEDVAQIDRAYCAPHVQASWSDMRDHMRAILVQQNQPADGFLLIGDTAFEREWAVAGKTAGYLPAQSYFAPPQEG